MALPSSRVRTQRVFETCWSLSYNGNTINVLATDHAAEGFNIAQEAMDLSTGGQAVVLGKVDAQYVQVDGSVCGL